MGYTTGPSEYNADKSANKPVAQTNYMSVWQRQPDDSWKVILDVGVSGPPNLEDQALSNADDSKDAHAINRKIVRENVTAHEAGVATLSEAERRFAADAFSQGTLKAYALCADKQIRLLKTNQAPAVGQRALQDETLIARGNSEWRLQGSGVSQQGDLGFTYGDYQTLAGDAQSATAAENGVFVRVWRKRGGGGKGWRIVLNLLKPMAKK